MITYSSRVIYTVVQEWIHAAEGVTLSDENTHVSDCGECATALEYLRAAERAHCAVFSDLDEFSIVMRDHPGTIYSLAQSAQHLARSYLIDMSVDELSAHLHTLLAAEASCVENEIPITWCEED